MNTKYFYTLFFALITALTITSCGSDPVPGCTDPNASNYNPDANENTGCIYRGCTNSAADNYDPNANEDDGSCIIKGCTNAEADNFNVDANEDDGSCIFRGCTDEDGDNYDAMHNEDDGSCTYFGLYEGNYAGDFACNGVIAGVLSTATMEVVKVNAPDNVNEVKLLVSNDMTDFSLGLDGTIDKEKITIDTYIENFDFEIEILGQILEGPFEITVTGELTRNENGVKGPVSFIITQIASATTITDDCEYDAEKVE